MKKIKHAPDYEKNVTADVIKHGDSPAVPEGQWEVYRDITPHGDGTGWGAFLPRTAKSRPTTHTKTNECDH